MEDYKFLEHLQDFFVVVLHGRSPTWQNFWRRIHIFVNIQTQIKIVKLDIKFRAKDWQRVKDTWGIEQEKFAVSYSINKLTKICSFHTALIN